MAIKNLTSLFPLIFLSKHISLYALGRLKWILDIIWPLNQYFDLKNQRNWIKQVLMLKFLSGINCILLHWKKKLTLVFFFLTVGQNNFTNKITFPIRLSHSGMISDSNKVLTLVCRVFHEQNFTYFRFHSLKGRKRWVLHSKKGPLTALKI